MWLKSERKFGLHGKQALKPVLLFLEVAQDVNIPSGFAQMFWGRRRTGSGASRGDLNPGRST